MIFHENEVRIYGDNEERKRIITRCCHPEMAFSSSFRKRETETEITRVFASRWNFSVLLLNAAGLRCLSRPELSLTISLRRFVQLYRYLMRGRSSDYRRRTREVFFARREFMEFHDEARNFRGRGCLFRLKHG